MEAKQPPEFIIVPFICAYTIKNIATTLKFCISIILTAHEPASVHYNTRWCLFAAYCAKNIVVGWVVAKILYALRAIQKI